MTSEVNLRQPPRLVRDNSHFRRILYSVGLGAVSGGVITFIVDIIAVTVLGVGAFEIGLLNAAGTMGYLLLSIPFGVWIDRLPRIAVMIWCELAFALVVLSVPLAYAANALTFAHLLIASFLSGLASLGFGIASSSVLPAIVGRPMLSEAYARQETVGTAVSIVVPGVAGQLLRIVAAPLILLIAAASSILSALALLTLRKADLENVDRAAERESFGASLRSGVAFTLKCRPVLLLMASTTVMNFGLALGSSVEVVYLIRTLGFSPALVSIIFSAIAAGGFLSSLAAPRIIGWLGQLTSLRSATFALAPVVALQPLAAFFGSAALVLVLAHVMIYAMLLILFNANSYAIMATVTPDHLLGRQQSFRTFTGMGMVPIGAIAGGVLGDALGYTAVLWIWVGLSLLIAVPLLWLRQGELEPEGATLPS